MLLDSIRVCKISYLKDHIVVTLCSSCVFEVDVLSALFIWKWLLKLLKLKYSVTLRLHFSSDSLIILRLLGAVGSCTKKPCWRKHLPTTCLLCSHHKIHVVICFSFKYKWRPDKLNIMLGFHMLFHVWVVVTWEFTWASHIHKNVQKPSFQCVTMGEIFMSCWGKGIDIPNPNWHISVWWW